MSNPLIRPYQEGNIAATTDRSQAMRRDNDLVKVPRVTLYDIDYAVYYHLTQKIKIQVVDNDTIIQVPVMFSNGEKWSQIRQHGYLRGADKKVLAPIMVIRRTGIVTDDRLAMSDGAAYKLFPYKKTSMQWDRTAGQYLKKDTVEYYMVNFPDYVIVSYELIIWTDLQEQMNSIVQSIIPTGFTAWGDTHTFTTSVEDITHDNVNVPGEDRLIKTTMTLRVDGYLREDFEYQQSNLQKQYSIKTVRFLEEGSEKVVFDAEDEYPTSDSRLEIPTQNKDTIKEESDNMRKTIRR